MAPTPTGGGRITHTHTSEPISCPGRDREALGTSESLSKMKIRYRVLRLTIMQLSDGPELCSTAGGARWVG